MGLFDKIREVVDSVLGSGNSPQKRYYDIVLNLLSTVKCLTKENIKTYFKVKLNEDCDDAVLEAVLSKFERTARRKTGETWYELTSEQFRKNLDAHFSPSPALKEEICNICFADYFERTRARFGEVLETIKNCADSFHLEQACDAMIEYPESECPHYDLTGKVMGEEMIKRFLSGDPTVVAIVEKKAFDHMIAGCRDKKHWDEFIALLYSIALRGLHFEKFGKGTAEYASITKEDCDNAMLNASYYKKQIDKTPYYKDSIITSATSSILKAKPFVGSYPFEWDTWAIKNDHFVDAVCNFVWKKIASEYENGETRDIEDIVKILYNYTVNSVNAD